VEAFEYAVAGEEPPRWVKVLRTRLARTVDPALLRWG
jgi:hypothetical protein